MVDELLDLLGRELNLEPSDFSCPDPARLAATAIGSFAGIDVTELARHLTRCITCARRWELLQQDACIGAGEAMALLRLRADHFARVRAGIHAQGCKRCDKIITAFCKMGELTASALRPDGLVLPVNLLAFSRKSALHEEVSAAVLDIDGAPCIAGDKLLQHRTVVLESSVHDSVLSIILQAGTEFASASLAIFPEGDTDSEFPIFLPDVEVIDGIASWRIKTTAQEGHVPIRSLAVTLVARRVA